jgi:zinc D-Ala-D-Ala carboxypeptidase
MKSMSEWNYRFFNKNEFVCGCCGKAEMDDEFMRKMVNLRLAAKQPVLITSGFRCEKHNKKVGGASHSPHLEGLAADIEVLGADARRLVGAAEFCGFSGIGISQKGDWSSRFIHVDNAKETENRPRPWIWSY